MVNGVCNDRGHKTHLNVISVGFNLPEKVIITKTDLSTETNLKLSNS